MQCLGYDDGTPRGGRKNIPSGKRRYLFAGQLYVRGGREVIQLVETGIEIRVAEESVLMPLHLANADPTLPSSDNQPPFLVDHVADRHETHNFPVGYFTSAAFFAAAPSPIALSGQEQLRHGLQRAFCPFLPGCLSFECNRLRQHAGLTAHDPTCKSAGPFRLWGERGCWLDTERAGNTDGRKLYPHQRCRQELFCGSGGVPNAPSKRTRIGS